MLTNCHLSEVIPWVMKNSGQENWIILKNKSYQPGKFDKTRI